MLTFSGQWITGCMLGIEFPDVREFPPTDRITFAFVIDLFIIRLLFTIHEQPPTMNA